MRERELWELEVEEIDATCSPAAMADLWCEILAGLWAVEAAEEQARLALKAQALLPELVADPELRAYLEERIDLIVYERRRDVRAEVEAGHGQ